MSLFIDFNVLHTVPPSLINRDDTGAPKTAIFGGVPRQRISSQSAKRAIRKSFEDTMDSSKVGFRTKRVAELIVDRIQSIAGENGFDAEHASKGVEALFKAAKIKLTTPPAPKGEESEEDTRRRLAETGYLLFLSDRQVQKAAEAILAKEELKFSKNEAKEILDTDHSVDVAMFGRMVADDPNFNVDASVQVAHALSVHEAEPEFDYFTAVDDYVEDKNEETGAGMIGTTQMMSSTLYRYANIDVESLAKNLGDREAAIEASVAFARAFVDAMPTGKQNTFANRTLPELVYVTVRGDRPISLVNAFEDPVLGAGDKGRRQVSAQRLATEAKEIQEQFGFTPIRAMVAGLGGLQEEFASIAEVKTLPELYEALRESLEEQFQ